MNVWTEFHGNPPYSCWDISLKVKHCQPGKEKFRGSPKSSGFILWGMSVRTFHVNPSSSCWDISVWTDRTTKLPKHLLPQLCSPCVTEHNTNPPDSDGQLYMPSASEAHEAISIHKGRSPLIGFPGQMLAQLTKIAPYITHGFDLSTAEPGDTKRSKTRLVYSKDVSASRQRTSPCNLQLRPAWLWTVLELSL